MTEKNEKSKGVNTRLTGWPKHDVLHAGLGGAPSLSRELGSWGKAAAMESMGSQCGKLEMQLRFRCILCQKIKDGVLTKNSRLV